MSVGRHRPNVVIYNRHPGAGAAIFMKVGIDHRRRHEEKERDMCDTNQ